MPVDYIRYDILTQEALRGVVRTVIADAAKNGLPGDHHFYITFDTHAPGVAMSERLRGQYPQDMTIVLQHQFWDLALTEDGFQVGLAFNGITERLSVPFAAIKAFFDPSVQFGLQFEVLSQEAGQAGDPAAQSLAPVDEEERTKAERKSGERSSGERKSGERKERTPARHQPRQDRAEPLPAAANPDATKDRQPSPGGEVVRLDRFRKK